MILLHSLGKCMITVGAARLLPNAKLMFASALYVALEGTRTIARDAMASVFWPELSPEHATHSLRQALYRLRAQGVPVSSEGDQLLLAPGLVATDFDELLAPAAQCPVDQMLTRIPGGFLPGYTPTISTPFAAWVEAQRGRVNAALRRQLVSGIATLRAAGDWPATQALAERCLELDPLNEEATLAYAEALAMDGSKARAIMIIDRYMNEIGPRAPELHEPAVSLKKRIAGLYPLPPVIEKEPPQVGREAEMEKLDAALKEARQGRGSAHLISGPPGMGKTRLVTEFTRAAQLQGIATVKSQMGRHDDHRPLGAWSDLVPQLQRMPGALGCDPESLPYLRRLTTYDAKQTTPSPEAQDAEYLFARIRLSVLDLVGAVASESCVILLIEDVHWMDEWSWDVLSALTKRLEKTGVLVLLTRREGDEPSTAVPKDAALRMMPLAPLDESQCHRLLAAVASASRMAEAGFQDWCARTCAGNPYFLVELGRRASTKEGRFQAPSSLTKLIAERFLDVAPLSQRILQAAAVLGKNATLARIERMLGERRLSLLDGLDELGRRSLLLPDGERVVCQHDLLGISALGDISDFSFRSLHRHAAQALESEISEHSDASQLWDCALHWERACEHERAFHLLMRCADLAVETGAATEAVRVLEFALQKAAGTAEREAIEERLMSVLAVTRQFGRIVEIVGRRTSDGAYSRRPSPMHGRNELIELEARLHYAGPSRELMERVLSFIADESPSCDLRVEAGLIGLQSAYLCCAPRAARRIYSRVQPMLSEASSICSARFRMIYEGSFGNTRESAKLARIVLGAMGDSPESGPVRARYLKTCALALWLGGATAEATACGLEMLDLAKTLELPGLAWTAVDYLVEQALVEGDLDAAERYLSTLPSTEHAWGQRHRAAVRQSVRVALWRGDVARARNLLGPFPSIWGSSFMSEALYTTEVRASLVLKEGGWVPSDSDLARLLQMHRHGRKLPSHDSFVVMLVEALAARGEQSAIPSLVTTYVSQYRRECGPLLYRLRMLLESLDIAIPAVA